MEPAGFIPVVNLVVHFGLIGFNTTVVMPTIQVGTRVKARSRIFGEEWAKAKYGTGAGGWTQQWEEGLVKSARGHHLWSVEFEDGSLHDVASRQLQICSAPSVVYDEDDPDQYDEDINENDPNIDDDGCPSESDGSDSDDDVPLTALRHVQRAGKVLTWGLQHQMQRTTLWSGP